MTEDDLFHTGATVFIQGRLFVLGNFDELRPGWELLVAGEHVATVNPRRLLQIIDGVKFATHPSEKVSPVVPSGQLAGTPL